MGKPRWLVTRNIQRCRRSGSLTNFFFFDFTKVSTPCLGSGIIVIHCVLTKTYGSFLFGCFKKNSQGFSNFIWLKCYQHPFVTKLQGCQRICSLAWYFIASGVGNGFWLGGDICPVLGQASTLAWVAERVKCAAGWHWTQCCYQGRELKMKSNQCQWEQDEDNCCQWPL